MGLGCSDCLPTASYRRSLPSKPHPSTRLSRSRLRQAATLLVSSASLFQQINDITVVTLRRPKQCRVPATLFGIDRCTVRKKNAHSAAPESFAPVESRWQSPGAPSAGAPSASSLLLESFPFRAQTRAVSVQIAPPWLLLSIGLLFRTANRIDRSCFIGGPNQKREVGQCRIAKSANSE